jgi:hypothetical protein
MALYLAMLANALIFVRVAVIHSPYYSYSGPSGADRVYYYAYTRSVVVDRDLRFEDEFALRPPTSGAIFTDGRQLNKYPIGAPLLSVPAFALVHTVASILRASGLPLSTTGYSPPYAMTFALSQMVFAVLGVWLLYATLVRYFSRRVAALAVAGAWLGTNALHYTAVDLMMSHAAALFSTAWCGYEAATLRESAERPWKWCRLGMSAAFVCLVRYQNAVFLFVPGAAVLETLYGCLQQKAPVRWSIRHAASAVAGVFAVFLPQLLTWRIVFGEWVVNSYQREFAFDFRHPHLLDVLLAESAHGLLIWLPVLGIGMAGCLAIGIRRRDGVALAAFAAWTLNFYIISSWWDWIALAQRGTFDVLLPVALGLGALLHWVSERRQPALATALVIVLAAWSIPFAAMGVPWGVEPRNVAAAWLHCVRTLI